MPQKDYCFICDLLKAENTGKQTLEDCRKELSRFGCDDGRRKATSEKDYHAKDGLTRLIESFREVQDCLDMLGQCEKSR